MTLTYDLFLQSLCFLLLAQTTIIFFSLDRHPISICVFSAEYISHNFSAIELSFVVYR